jgi:hypothetical protein
MPGLLNMVTRGLILAYGLLHSVFLLALILATIQGTSAFLPPWLLLAWYGAALVACAILLFRTRRDRASPWLLVLPLVLTLAAIGAVRPPGPDGYEWNEVFIALNLAAGLAILFVALLYRWPGLLLAWGVGQGLLLATYPRWEAELWKFGLLASPIGMATLCLGLPVLYIGAAFGLGLRWPPGTGRILGAGLGVGIVAAVVTGIHFYADRPFSTASGALDQLGFWLGWSGVYIVLWGTLVVSLPLLTGLQLRRLAVLTERRFPWEVFVLTFVMSPLIPLSRLTTLVTGPSTLVGVLGGVASVGFLVFPVLAILYGLFAIVATTRPDTSVRERAK